jgi:hypothetical protein
MNFSTSSSRGVRVPVRSGILVSAIVSGVVLYLALGGTAGAARWTLRPAARSTERGTSTLPGASSAAAHWAPQRTPDPSEPSGSALIGVSCRSRSWCMAVGGAGIKRGHMFAERWDGREWTLLRVPPPTGAGATVLNDVSCKSTQECVAVGTMTKKGHMRALVERWDDGAWRPESVPTRSGYATSALYGVSCLSKGACLAVGERDDRSGDQFPLLERWNGSRWIVGQAVDGVNGLALLIGVSCTSSTACTAVGVDAGTEGLAVRWNGKRWLAEPGSNPDNYNGSGLGAVSCVSRSFCAAAGGGSDADSINVSDSSVAELWNGTRWSVSEEVDPNNTINYDLFGVSCASTTACLAVGYVAERWNGRSWSLEQIPTMDALNAVSCPSRSMCVAVGVASVHNRDRPLAIRWSR